MSLPHRPSIGVAIESFAQSAAGSVILWFSQGLGLRSAFVHTLGVDPPGIGPCLFGDRHPRLSTGQLRLHIGLLSVCLLNAMTWKTTITVDIFACLHRSRRRSQVLKYCGLKVLIAHVVALEHHTVLVLIVWVPISELGVLEYT